MRSVALSPNSSDLLRETTTQFSEVVHALHAREKHLQESLVITEGLK